MRLALLPLAALIAASALAAAVSSSSASDDGGQVLRPAEDFASIADVAARSKALFEEAGKVILHPRCVNCHVAGDSPLQGMEMRVHQPPVARGDGDIGLPGMPCGACHGVANVQIVGQSETLQSIPGHPEWRLAPVEMAWQGITLGEICARIKDPDRNGGRSLAEIVEHMAGDTLVGWGWNPGAGREPAPGSQDVFGKLLAAWAETGAACP